MPNEPAELWADVQPAASRRMLVAAVDAFAARGYSATTTREIADRAGMSPAGVYIHYRTKADLLHEISLAGSQSLLDAVKRALNEHKGPTERLRAFVAAFVAWHAHNRTIARVILYEMRELPADRVDQVDAVRGRCERLLRSELRRGAGAGEFRIDDQRTTARAILSLGFDVPRWYLGGPPSPPVLGRRYAELALHMVGRFDESQG